VSTELQVLLARDERRRARERRGVERVADHEPDQRQRSGDEQVAVDVERAAQAGDGQPDHGQQQQLEQAEDPETQDLAAEEVTRAQRREQQLDDPRAFSSTTPMATK
jgi:hypothetical protein